MPPHGDHADERGQELLRVLDHRRGAGDADLGGLLPVGEAVLVACGGLHPADRGDQCDVGLGHQQRGDPSVGVGGQRPGDPADARRGGDGRERGQGGVQTLRHGARSEDVRHGACGAAQDHGGGDAGEELADEEQDDTGPVDRPRHARGAAQHGRQPPAHPAETGLFQRVLAELALIADRGRMAEGAVERLLSRRRSRSPASLLGVGTAPGWSGGASLNEGAGDSNACVFGRSRAPRFRGVERTAAVAQGFREGRRWPKRRWS